MLEMEGSNNAPVSAVLSSQMGGLRTRRKHQRRYFLHNHQSLAISKVSALDESASRFSKSRDYRDVKYVFRTPVHHPTTSWIFSVLSLLLVLASCLAPVSGQQSGEELQQYYLEFSIREDAKIGTQVGVVRGDRFSPPYTRRIRTQSPDNLTINSFAVDLETGVITTTDYLNREEKDSHTIILTYQPSSTPQLVIIEIRILDINDVKPTFMKSTVDVSISESAPKDYKIPLGSVRDEDLGTNSTQTIEIVSGNEDKDFALEVKNSSNVDKILDLVVTQRKLNYERTQLYTLVIRATDGGGQFSEMTVNINVLDQNDNEPIFNMSKYSKRVAENVTVGTQIIRVQATDADSGNNSQISYSIDHRTDPEEYFTIDAVTGWVRVNKPLDYETRSRFALTLEAWDNGNSPLQGTAALDVILENINETPANISLRFEPAFPNALVPEDTPVDTVVAVVLMDGSERDAARGQMELYKDAGYFELRRSADSLELVLSSSLNREKDARLDMTLQVTDTGFPPLRASHAFTVIIGDVNDNDPVFSQAEYTATVEETAEVGQEVIRVNATDKDADANGRVTYSLQDGSQHMGWFSVDAVTGAISTRATLDCELSPHPTLVVVATDGGDPPRIGSAQVTISVRDVNDKEPEFETSFYSIKVAENRRVGDCILTVSATDPECGTNSPVTYKMARMLQPLQEFRVDGTSGAVCLQTELDFEMTSTYQFQVEAVDSDGLSTQAVVQVEVTDVNDNHPRFEPQDYRINVMRGAMAGPLVTVQARDGDSGDLGTVTYSLVGGNQAGYFTVDPSTGSISLVQPLPAEPASSSSPVYDLRVRATDGGGLTSLLDAQVRVSVISGDLHPPVFSPTMFNFTVGEGAGLGRLVGQVQASLNVDSMADLTGQDVEIKYTSQYQTAEWFEVDPMSGDIYTKEPLDRETHQFVVISVQAEAYFPPVYARAQVNITILDENDNPPYFPATTPLELEVREDEARGAAIYSAKAFDRDLDNNGLVRYRLDQLDDRDEVITRDEPMFSIGADSGEISLTGTLDFEKTREYRLLVVATDQGSSPLSANMTLTVRVKDVNDNSPEFTRTVYEMRVPENVVLGFKVGTVLATDADSDNNKRVSYSLRGADNDAAAGNTFGIGSVDGVIWTRDALDRELRDSYQLVVEAADHGSPKPRTATARVRILVEDVNDNWPEFSRSEYRFSVQENLEHDTFVGKVTASDRDSEENGRLRYYFGSDTSDTSSGVIFDAPQASFTIDSDTGEIRTQISLNREYLAEHVLDVFVSDHGSSPHTSRAIVRVKVEDDNDNDPVFLRQSPFRLNVTENRPKGTLVTTILAEDIDSGENGMVTYFFDKERSEPAALDNFEIHPRTGKMTTKEVLDFETMSTYLLTVVAEDNGRMFRRTSAGVIVSVLDANDQDPLFQAREVRFTVVENTPINTQVGWVQATDGDSGDNGLVNYYLIGGNVFSCFSVNRTSGEITTVRDVDYEEASSHRLSIEAVDSSASLPRSSNITVIIQVVDVNDNAPKFEQDPVIIRTVAENTAPAHVIHTFMATDRDSGLNGTVLYSIESYSGQELGLGPYFDIDRQNGDLYVVGEIDYEKVDTITVIVKAEDASPNREDMLFSLITTIVFVTDVNDNAPKFESSDQLTLSEDESIGYVVLVVLAADPDSNIDGSGNNVVRYSIVSGNEDGRFALGADSGFLRIHDALDYETRSSYVLNISAEDSGMPTKRSSYQALTITLTDVNDNAPEFERSVYHASVLENADPDTSVVTVQATDADTGNNGALTYVIPNGIAEDRFAVNPKTGLLTTKERLNREEKDSYIVTVYVNDGAYPNHFSSATVLITVLDVNDNTPVFKMDKYSVAIPENRPQVALLSVVASDKDLDENGHLTYSLSGDNIDDSFSIDPQHGTLSCSPLDREGPGGGSYTLTVTATDHGDPNPRSATATVHVTVLDENDNSPTFTDAAYKTSISEDTPLNQVILTVTATDPDLAENGRVMYYLGNDTEGFFQVNSTSGEIFTSSLFDREKIASYSFLIMASDQSVSGPRVSAARVTVNLLDVNDNPPVFREVPYTAELSVATPTGHNFLSVVAYDLDSGNNGLVVYSLVEDDGEGGLSTPDSLKYFRIDASGKVFTKTTLTAGQFSVLVKATDSAPKPQDKLSTIGVLEVKVGEEPPESPQFKFTKDEFSAMILEDAPSGSTVTTVEAAFTSSPAAASGTLYSFASGNEIGAFAIGSRTGKVTVLDTDKMDYETSPRVRLIVAAKNGNYHAYARLFINLTDVNDNAPKFSQEEYVSAIYENNERHTETYVTQVIARDADSGGNGDVTYSIIDGNDDKAFKISLPHTGIVHTDINAAILDYDSRPEGYRLIIQATDNGYPMLSSTCTLVITIVDENDNEPHFPRFDPIHVSENRDVGYMVAMVKANDVDLNPILVYDFTADGNPGGTFALDRSTGRLTLARRVDHEVQDKYSVGITVTDGVPNHDQTKWLDVFVDDENDNAPVFSQQSYEVALPEQTGPFQSVLTVVATDADSGHNAEVSYSMAPTPMSSFYIDAVTGVIYTSRVISFSSTESIIQLVVIARDNGTIPQSSMVAVHVQITDVNKHTPAFKPTEYEAHLSELAQKGTPVLQVTATDEDVSQHGDNINYRLQGKGSHLFYIHQRTGQITYRGGADYDQKKRYDLTVVATDRGIPPKNASARVTIFIDDENDNAPQFVKADGYSIDLLENQAPEDVFLYVNATDADSGQNAAIRYFITSGNSEGIFQNHNSNGGLMIMKNMKLDYETQTSHRLIMKAVDCANCPKSSPKLSAFVTVDINVLDVNEEEPSFPIKHYYEKVEEGAKIGTVVFRAHAVDGDGGEMGVLTYTLMSQHDYMLFNLNPDTGEVSTKEVFDFEMFNSPHFFKLTITARDQGQFSDFTEVSIRLVDVDEAAPELSKREYYFEVPGSAEAGDFVGQINATDRDKGETGRLVYEFVNPSEYFDIHPLSGIITVMVTLHEDPPSHSRRSKRALTSNSEDLIIKVSSGLPNSKNDTAALSISVDRTCIGCAAPIREVAASTSMDGGVLAGIIVGCILFIVLAVVVILFLVYRRKKPGKCVPNYSSDSTLDLEPPPHLPTDRAYADVIRAGHSHIGSHLNHLDPMKGGGGNAHLIGSDISDQSHNSASSGRGSAEAEEEEDEDEEISRINSNSQLHSSQAFRQKAMPDSGIQHDDDTLSEPSATTHQEYLANLGIDSSKIGRAKMPLPYIPTKPAPTTSTSHNKRLGRSAESMNHFTDEGGGEGGVDTDMDRMMTDMETDDEVAAAEARTLEARTAHGMNFHEPDTHNVGSLSNVVNSEEVNGGSYNWDYLIDWGPQYQPLAHVFSEIAKLKDESVTPKKQPIKTVPQRQYSASLKQPQVRTVPPPIITNAPPMSVPLAPAGEVIPPTSMPAAVHPDNIHFAPPAHHSPPVPARRSLQHHQHNHNHNHNHHQPQHHPHHYHLPQMYNNSINNGMLPGDGYLETAHHPHHHHHHLHHNHNHHHHHHSPRMGIHPHLHPPQPPANPPPPLPHHIQQQQQQLLQQKQQQQQQQQQQLEQQQQSSSGRSGSQPTSAHASTMNVSLPSLPRSPISYESSLNSAAMTPSLTPSLSPLATRSPSISPVVSGHTSGQASGHTTPGKSGSRQKLPTGKMRTTSNSHSISSNSDKEFTI